MQQIYAEPVKEELIAERIREIKAEGVVCAASLTPRASCATTRRRSMQVSTSS